MGALTFDCTGLAPGRPQELPGIHDWLDIAEDERSKRLRSLGLALGPHLQAGKANLAILRGLLALAHRLLSELPQCLGVCWAASGVVTSKEAYLRMIDPEAEAGHLPVALLASFKPGLGAGLESRGLAYFTSQELRIEPGPLADGAEAKQLGLRFVNHLIHRGKLTESEPATTPDGRPVRLEPSANGRFVRVWPG